MLVTFSAGILYIFSSNTVGLMAVLTEVFLRFSRQMLGYDLLP
jgi:hypothetical protein